MTISKFYPDASPENTSVDGRAGRDGVNETFSAIRAGAGNYAADSAATMTLTVNASATSNQYASFLRGFLLFDTSDLEGQVISAATMGFVLVSAVDTFAEAGSFSMVNTNPASETQIVSADYQNAGTTKQAADLPISGMTADSAAFNYFTLNSTGLDSISQTGVTKFGMVATVDVEDDAPTWGSEHAHRIGVATAEETLSSDKRPVLTVTHAAPSFVPRAMIF